MKVNLKQISVECGLLQKEFRHHGVYNLKHGANGVDTESIFKLDGNENTHYRDKTAFFGRVRSVLEIKEKPRGDLIKDLAKTYGKEFYGTTYIKETRDGEVEEIHALTLYGTEQAFDVYIGVPDLKIVTTNSVGQFTQVITAEQKTAKNDLSDTPRQMIYKDSNCQIESIIIESKGKKLNFSLCMAYPDASEIKKPLSDFPANHPIRKICNDLAKSPYLNAIKEKSSALVSAMTSIPAEVNIEQENPLAKRRTR